MDDLRPLWDRDFNRRDTEARRGMFGHGWNTDGTRIGKGIARGIKASNLEIQAPGKSQGSCSGVAQQGGNSVKKMGAKAEICGKKVEISGMKPGFFTLFRAISAYFRVRPFF